MKITRLIQILCLLCASTALAQKGQSGAQVGTQNGVINGDILFNQRGNVTGIVSGAYFVDRLMYAKNGTMVHNASQATDAPTLTQSGRASTYSAALALTTAQTSIGAADYTFIEHKIEGVNWAGFAGKPITLSFWVKATVTGTYAASFHNSAFDRSYVAPFTITSSETWEKKIITAPPPPNGTWLYDTNIGLRIRWTLASGSTYQTSTLNAWQSGPYVAPASQVNGVNTGATNFKLAQVMLNTGPTAAPFALAGGDVQGELAKCQRYYEKSFALGTSVPSATYVGASALSCLGNSATNCVVNFSYAVTKRTAPVAATNIFIYPATTGSSADVGKVDQQIGSAASARVAITPYNTSTFGFNFYTTGVANGTVAQMVLQWAADAEL